MTMEEVKQKLNDGEYKTTCVPKFRRYPVGYIFDENQSVVWNRKEVERCNEEYRREQENIRKEFAAKSVAFEEDVISSLQSDYNFSKARSVLIYREAYDRGHANGYYEVISQAEILAEFVEKILAAT